MTTYHIVVDTVNGRVGNVSQRSLLSQVVLDMVDAQVSDLVECPATDAPGKLLVPSSNCLLATWKLDLCVKPFVLEHLGRAHNGEAGGVAGLEGGNERKLLAGRKNLVYNLGLVLLVVEVGCPGGPQDGREERTVAQGVAETARKGEQVLLAAAAEIVLGVVSIVAWGGHKDDIVEVAGGVRIVVEMVNDQTGPFGGDVDVQLEKESVQGCGDWLRGAQSKQDIATSVEEVKYLLGSQVWAKS